ncbi:hypothetical protein B7494_g2278 [Chlorociboria aeruginascens]|nr:hypothetical protein B7494_g2278 [Chlorociboria aeruginascens]
MVLFVDLEHDVEPPESLLGLGLGLGLELENGLSSPPLHWSAVNNKGVLNVNVNVNVNVALRPLVGGRGGGKVQAVEEKERANPNKNAITEALGCYPIITSIASHIDLNTLDALSLTCRQIRANLLQFRTQLLASTLHCENEELKLDPEHTLRYRARAANWYFVDMSRETVGKAGDCARDMVDGCRRTAQSNLLLRSCFVNGTEGFVLPFESTLNPETLRRATCTCPDRVWLCQSCGRGLYSADAEYEGIWKWRTRYLPSLGGLGVGIGEGNQGVPCGRGSDCIAAREVEQETDCDAEDAKDVTRAVMVDRWGPGMRDMKSRGLEG